MGEITIGTSGYSYNDWVGAFYPVGLPIEERLGYYARFFSFVELNFSYYKMPDAVQLRKMVAQTPQNFRFSIKTHKSLSHVRSGDWREECALFKKACEAMLIDDRLACVVLQLPFSFHYNDVNRVYLASLLNEFNEVPIAIEYRNVEWYNDRVFDELKKRGVALIMVDEPSLANLPRADSIATAEFSYIRFHGRNKDDWWSGDNVSRYDYDYSDNELREWLPRIGLLREGTSHLYVAMNNHAKARAIKNARQLEACLGLFEQSKERGL